MSQFEKPNAERETRSKALLEAEAAVENIKALEKSGATVEAESERKEKRKKLIVALSRFQELAHKHFEESGAIGNSLLLAYDEIKDELEE